MDKRIKRAATGKRTGNRRGPKAEQGPGKPHSNDHCDGRHSVIGRISRSSGRAQKEPQPEAVLQPGGSERKTGQMFPVLFYIVRMKALAA